MLYLKAFIEIYMFQIFDFFSYWIMIVHFLLSPKQTAQTMVF